MLGAMNLESRPFNPIYNHIWIHMQDINMLPQICCFNYNLFIAPWWLLLAFIASLSLWLVNKKMRSCWRDVNELYTLYLLHHANGQMHVYLIASSVAIINKRNDFAVYQARWSQFHVEICMRVLGPIQLLLKLLSSTYCICKSFIDFVNDH